MPATRPQAAARARLSGFDYFVLAGAGVNLLVIAYLIAHWLFAR
jgi:hypothetical protein